MISGYNRGRRILKVMRDFFLFCFLKRPCVILSGTKGTLFGRRTYIFPTLFEGGDRGDETEKCHLALRGSLTCCHVIMDSNISIEVIDRPTCTEQKQDEPGG